jgi:hypothetical protein
LNNSINKSEKNGAVPLLVFRFGGGGWQVAFAVECSAKYS